MKIEVSKGGFDYEHEYSTVTDVIYRLIHVYASLISNRKKWLSARETEYYTALLVTYYKGLRYDKAESDHIFEAIFGKLSINRRKDYLKKIEDRGWVKIGESDELIFPEIFRAFGIDSESYEIKINLSWD